MRIAIKFGDNDFGNTFRALMRLLAEANIRHRSDNETDLERGQILYLVNQCAFSCYLLGQHRFKYAREDEKYFNFDKIKSWLKISESDILIDDEVDKYIDNLPSYGDNGETFGVDIVYVNGEPIIQVWTI